MEKGRKAEQQRMSPEDEDKQGNHGDLKVQPRDGWRIPQLIGDDMWHMS